MLEHGVLFRSVLSLFTSHRTLRFVGHALQPPPKDGTTQKASEEDEDDEEDLDERSLEFSFSISHAHHVQTEGFHLGMPIFSPCWLQQPF